MSLVPARRSTAAIFVLNGFVLGMWVVNMQEILDRTSTSKAEFGALLLLLGGSALVGMQLAGRLVDQHGSRPVAVIASLMSCAALVGPSLATGVTSLAVSLALLGFMNGGVDVAQNAHAVEVERGYGRPVMSAFHAFFSLGGVLAALLGGGFIAAGVDLRVSLTIGAVAGGFVVLSTRRSLLPPPPRTRTDRSHTRVAWSARVLLLGLLAFALLLAEGAGYDWSTVHLHDSLGASKTVAVWAFGAFSVTMTTVRLLADRLVARFGPGSLRASRRAAGCGRAHRRRATPRTHRRRSWVGACSASGSLAALPSSSRRPETSKPAPTTAPTSRGSPASATSDCWPALPRSGCSPPGYR